MSEKNARVLNARAFEFGLSRFGKGGTAHYPSALLADICRRGWDDLRQEFACELLARGIDPFSRGADPREVLRALDRAIYRTARFLGWRKLRSGRWVVPTDLGDLEELPAGVRGKPWNFSPEEILREVLFEVLLGV